MAAVWKPSWERAWKIVTDFDLKYSRDVYYDPLHFLSLMADQALVNSLGPNPGIAKVVNVTYHVINSLLVFAFLLMTGAGTRASFIGALVFAAHPMQVGTVAWIGERKNLLVTLFYLASIILFLKYLSRGSARYLVFVAILFILGLLSKPSAVTLPAALLCLVAVCNPEKAKDRGVIYLLAALLVLAMGWGVYVLSTERTYASILPPWPYRPLIAAGAVWFYLWKFFAPLQLVPLYPRWDVVGDPGWFIVLLIALVVLAGVLVYFRKRLDRWILWGVLFFLINLSLVSGLIPFGYMTYTFVADHFLYLPMIGLALIIARCIHIFSRSFRFDSVQGKVVVVALYAWVAILGLASVKQTLLWRDPYSVWEETLEVNKTSFAAYNNFGVLCLARGEYEKAIRMFREAAALAPKPDKPYENIGRAFTLMGDIESAKRAYKKSLEIDPTAELPQRMIGRILDREGRFDDAIATFRKALAANPDSGALYNDMGLSLYRSGREEDSMRAFDKAIQLTPFFPDPYVNKATALLSRGDADGAIPLLQRAISLDSGFLAHNVLGAAYAHKHEYSRALIQFITAYRIQANYPGIRDNVANAMMDMKNYDAAALFCSESAEKGLPCSTETLNRISGRLP